MKHLILVGACYLDTILTVPHFPDEDSKLRANSLEVRRGGNCPNTLEVLLQLLRLEQRPVTPHLVSCLPSSKSPATAKILSSFGLEPSDVDFSHCLYREGHTEPPSSYIVRSVETGSRTIVNYNDLPDMTLDEFMAIADDFKDQGECLWHFEGRIPETVLACIRYLRRALPDSKISVEVEKPGREGLRELAAEADIVFYSRTWAEGQGYDTAEACLRGESPPRASLAFCTWGAQGASALSLPARQYIQCAAARAGWEVKVVDTLGAGDTFIAAVLFGVLCHNHDWDSERKVRFAVDLATKKVQMNGFAGLVGNADHA